MKVVKTMRMSMITNIILSLMKIVSGIFGGSGALIADGIHSLSDLSTDVIAVIGNHLAMKPADEKHPYGHGKIEYITSILISMVILLLGLSIFTEAFQREIVIPSFLVAIVSFITIVMKYILARHLIKVGEQEKNNILLASGYESETDVISSIVVFVSILFMQFSKLLPILKYADVIAMLLVACLILKIGFSILKENVSIILESQEMNPEYRSKIASIILKEKKIRHIDALRILKYGAYYKLDVEVSMDPWLSLFQSHQYAHEAENRLKEFDEKISYVSIHVNPDEFYHLRKVKKDDLKRVKDLLKEKDYEVLKESYVILVRRKIIGVVECFTKEDTLFIERIFIEPEYRYCGIGTHILSNFVEKWPRIELEVPKENMIAYRLARKYHFETKKETKNYWNMVYEASK